jgi:hypothetical protein
MTPREETALHLGLIKFLAEKLSAAKTSAAETISSRVFAEVSPTWRICTSWQKAAAAAWKASSSSCRRAPPNITQ